MTPFTLEHFEVWAADVVLDNGEAWRLEPFQAAFVSDVFAGFRECWDVVPEGNGKTTLMAGIALYHCEHTPTASVPVAASSREQAEILYRQAEGMVLRTSRLASIFKCQEGYRRIKHLCDGGRIQVFAADDRTGDGLIPTLALIDELHRHRDLRLYRTWRGKLAKRDGQIATISTAGEPGGEFEETRERIRQSATETTRDGSFVRAVAGGVVLHEWAVPEDADVEDMAVVKTANPFSGVTVELLAEKRNSPTMTLEHWRRFVCNLPTRSGHAAIAEQEWFGQESTERIPEGVPVFLGLDVGWKWDTTALVPLWVREPEFRLLGDAVVLAPPRDGTMLDGRLIERELLKLHDRNPIETVVMDMSRAEQLAAFCETELGATVIDRTQSNAAAVEDYDAFMEGLREQWLWHSGCRKLTRHALNAVARVLPFGDARFDRPSQTRQGGDQDARVIDALVAAAMAHTVAMIFEAPLVFMEAW